MVILLAGFASMSTNILLGNPFRPKCHPVSFAKLKHQNFILRARNVCCMLISAMSCEVILDHAFVFLDSASCLLTDAEALFISQSKNVFGSPNLPMGVIFKT